MVNAEQFSNGLRDLRRQLASIQGATCHSTAEQHALQQVQAVADQLEVTAQLIEDRQRRLMQSRAELAARYQAYGALVDSFNCACLVTDRDGAVLDANGVAVVLLGHRDLALLRRKPLVVFIPTPERRAFRHNLLQAGSVRDMAEWQVHLLPRGRAPFPARLNMAPVRSDSGEVRELCWTIHNLDEAAAPAIPWHGQDPCEEVARQRVLIRAVTDEQVAWQEDTEGALAHQLYNRLGQDLTALLLNRAELDRPLAASNEQSSSAASGKATSARREQIAEVYRRVRSLMADLQDLAGILRPLSLDLVGLLPALREMADARGKVPDAPVKVEATGFDDHRLKPELERLVFRFVQEVLSLFEHEESQGGSLSVTLSWNGPWVRVAVEGQPGISMPEELDGHPGWRAVKGRVEVLGGTAGVEGSEDGETLIWAAVPALEAA